MQTLLKSQWHFFQEIKNPSPPKKKEKEKELALEVSRDGQ